MRWVAVTVTTPFSSCARVNSSPPYALASKPLPAIFAPLRATTLPCSVRSRMAYTAHWPVYWSCSVSSGSAMLQSVTFW